MAKITRIPQGLDITAGIGDELVLAVRIKKAGQPFDISGWTLSAQGVTLDVTDASTGEFNLTFTADQALTQHWFVRRDTPAPKRILSGFVQFVKTAGASTAGEPITLNIEDGAELSLEIVDPVATQPQQAFGLFLCDQGQAIEAVNQPQIVGMNTTVQTAGVTIVDNSKVTFLAGGFYTVHYALQFSNLASGPDARQANVWVRQNEVNIAASNFRYDVPRPRGETPGFLTATGHIIIEAEQNDFVQLVMAADSTDVSLATFPANGTIDKPVTPCVRLSAIEILR
jgi:hypothetical protein